MYAPLSLDGALGDVRLLAPSALPALRAAQAATDIDAYLLFRTTYALGFSKSWNNRHIPGHNSVIIGDTPSERPVPAARSDSPTPPAVPPSPTR